MELFSIPIILRAVELLFDIIILGVYYGTDTFFKASDTADNFGQFVIIGGMVSTVIMLGVCIALSLDKKMPYVVIGYNAVWAVFYFSAAILILNTFAGFDSPFFEQLKRGGLTVGSFCLFNVMLLIANSVFTFFGKES